MRVAIASGKGGTGKTTVATGLAAVAAQNGISVAYLDCDVEAPNGHLFLKPTFRRWTTVEMPVVEVDPSRCTHCGRCSEFCQFGAIAALPKKTMVFAELCHGCGGCPHVCPAEAIRETTRRIGLLREGTCPGIRLVEGRLDVGEPMSPPAIRAVCAADAEEEMVILDAPPGTACPAVETVTHAEGVVLVTEPTPFGLHDLGLAVGMVSLLKLPLGVVINRCDLGDDRVRRFCLSEGIPILLEIPHDRRLAEAYCRGENLAESLPEFGRRMEQLLCKIETERSLRTCCRSSRIDSLTR